MDRPDIAKLRLPGARFLRPGFLDPAALLEPGRAAGPGRSGKDPETGDSIQLEDYTPYSRSLEWRLARAFWLQAGLRPFIEGSVPYLVNNSGWLAERSAELLFVNCAQREDSQPIRALELGAGCGLFARRLLDVFQQRSRGEGKDFYDRLIYHATDRSPRTLEAWRDAGLFDDHGDRVRVAVCDAEDPLTLHVPDGGREQLSDLGAVFANYVLDSLDAAAIRREGDRRLVLCTRTVLPESEIDGARAKGLSVDRIRQIVGAGSEPALDELLPLLPLLEFATAFRDLPDAHPPLIDELDLPEGSRGALNYAAARSLEACVEALVPGGFVLVHDFGPADETNVDRLAHPSRFAESVAWPVNFPWLGRHTERRGIRCLELPGRPSDPVHARLFGRSLSDAAAHVFHERFADRSPFTADEALIRAAEAVRTGRHEDALECYREALQILPRDWIVLGQAAQFLNQQLLRHEEALQLAAAALQLNPWFSPFLWNTYGNCLFCLGEVEGAHECYARARSVDPQDAQARLNLSYTFGERGDYVTALECIAAGLARDRDERFRSTLLQKQRDILGRLDDRQARRDQRVQERHERFGGGR
jgi:tetratricopeptide (TPR) repeat protein